MKCCAASPGHDIEAAPELLDTDAAPPLNVWVCKTCTNHPIAFRTGPEIDAKKADHALHPGQALVVSEEHIGDNNVRFLKCADGRGWLFDRVPGVGTMCVREGEQEEIGWLEGAEAAPELLDTEVFLRSFEAEIRSVEGKKFGSQCVKWFERVELGQVAPDGALEEYNKSVGEELQVRAGDFLAKAKSVGQSDEDVREQQPQAMVDALKKGGDLKVIVVRPFRFDVEVSKEGTLGLRLEHTKRNAGIVVSEVMDGPFKAYNEAVPSDRPERVKAKDCIESVNGETAGSGAELADRIKGIEKGSKVKIGFIRFADA